MYLKSKIILIFVAGLVGSNYPMKAEAVAVARFSSTAFYNSTAMKEVFKPVKDYSAFMKLVT